MKWTDISFHSSEKLYDSETFQTGCLPEARVFEHSHQVVALFWEAVEYLVRKGLAGSEFLGSQVSALLLVPVSLPPSLPPTLSLTSPFLIL